MQLDSLTLLWGSLLATTIVRLSHRPILGGLRLTFPHLTASDHTRILVFRHTSLQSES